MVPHRSALVKNTSAVAKRKDKKGKQTTNTSNTTTSQNASVDQSSNLLVIGNMPRYPTAHISEITSVFGRFPGLIRLGFDPAPESQTAYPNLCLLFATIQDSANARCYINHNAVVIANKRVWTL
jgi:hypothetical protein